jgi:hypothetical protein
MRMMFRVLVLAAVYLSCAGCITSMDKGVEEHARPHEDGAYYKKYQSATRGGDVIRTFDVLYRIHATYLSPEFRSALVERMGKIYLEDAGAAFQEASAKAGFIVTVYGLDRDSVDLSNTNHWTILFENKDGPVKPILVKKIGDKVRWRNFFETISPWTQDYLVVFDKTAVNPNAENLVEKPITRLTLASGEGRIRMDW